MTRMAPDSRLWPSLPLSEEPHSFHLKIKERGKKKYHLLLENISEDVSLLQPLSNKEVLYL